MRLGLALVIAVLVGQSCTGLCGELRRSHLIEITWGFHASRMRASLLALETQREIDLAEFTDDTLFFETVTGIELTEKGYYGILPSQDSWEHLKIWTAWFEEHKQNLKMLCGKDGRILLKNTSSRARDSVNGSAPSPRASPTTRLLPVPQNRRNLDTLVDLSSQIGEVARVSRGLGASSIRGRK